MVTTWARRGRDPGHGETSAHDRPVDGDRLILRHPEGTGAIWACPAARAGPYSRTAISSRSTLCARRLRRRTHWPPVSPTRPRAAAVHARAWSVWRQGFLDASEGLPGGSGVINQHRTGRGLKPILLSRRNQCREG